MTYVKFIPLLPALGFLFNGLLGDRVPRKVVSLVGCGTVFLSMLLSFGCIKGVWDAQHVDRLEQTEIVAFTWIPGFDFITAGGEQARFTVEWGFLLDPLSAVMLFVVTFVGFLIHIYSMGYMAHEDGYHRFFAYLNLFMAMMLTLILANNMLLMFVGWEGVGLCSYLLIGFYYQTKFAPDAGKKAFVVNRIGDFGVVLATLFCLFYFGTVKFTEMVPTAVDMSIAGTLGAGTLTLICLLLFLGACGKSAQLPLYVWLPDAMAGPTPVSALIHAATMVTSGIYMIARLNPMFARSETALQVIAVVGCVTALWAATIALTQTDIKKVLAYSTVSQLGYMFLALGLGAWVPAVFHVMTHAFFKACLFLGSGSVIHAMSGEQDMRKMGGLRKHIPQTFWTFVIATVAIAGIAPLAGFFSKDEILWNAFGFGHPWLWAVGFATAGMTAFYMFRLVFMTFYQDERFDDHAREHLHESPPSMTVPLWILAGLSAFGGLVGIPAALWGSNHFHHFLAPVLLDDPTRLSTFGAHPYGVERIMALVSVVWAVLAIGVAFWMYYRETDRPKSFASALGPLYTGSLNKWYVDEVYDALVVNPVKKMTSVMDMIDRWLIDGVINGIRHATIGVSVVSKVFDVGVIDMLVNLVAKTVRAGGAFLRRFQTGSLQNYAYYFVLGLFVMVCIFLLAGGGSKLV